MRTIMAMAWDVSDGPLSDTLIIRTHDPVLVTSAHTLTTLRLGLIFSMTTKPSLVTSMLVMGVALSLGLCVSLLFWSATQRRAGQPGDHRPSAKTDPFLKQTLWTRRW